MPTGVFGDLVVEMGVDDRKWIEGVLRIQNSSKQMATNIQANTSTAGAAFGRGIGQMAFAAQDFASVLHGGGKMAVERALMSTMNNVQMLGAAMGPWGMAITAVGGALGAILIPKLMESKDVFDQLAESTAGTLKAFEKFGATMASINAFKLDLEKADSAKDAETMRKRLEGEKAAAKIRAAAALDAAGEIDRKIKEAEVAKKAGRKGLGLIPAMYEDWWADRKIDSMVADREAAIRAAGGHSADILAAEAKLKELGRPSTDEDIETRERHLRNELEDERDRETAKRLADQSRTPFQVAKDQLANITRLARQGSFGADVGVAAAAADKIVADFKLPQNNRTNQAVSGGEFGTSSGFSDVMKSIRQSTSSPELDVAKESKDELKKIVAALRAGLKLNPPVRTEGIE